MTIAEDLLRAAAYLSATNDSPDEEASIDADEADRIAGVLRGLAAAPAPPDAPKDGHPGPAWPWPIEPVRVPVTVKRRRRVATEKQ